MTVAVRMRTGLAAGDVLTVLLIALLVPLAAAGVFVDDLYRDDVALVQTSRAYDLVVLGVIAPLLAWSAVRSERSATNVRLVRISALVVVVYGYGLHTFGLSFNHLFVAHAAVLALAAAAVIVSARDVDLGALSSYRMKGVPARFVAGVLAVLGLSLAGMWTYFSLRYTLNGTEPQEAQLVASKESMHLAFAFDLVLLVPAYLTAAALLWRHRALGYAMSAVLAMSGLLLQLPYMAALVLQEQAGVPGATAFDPAEPLILAAYAVITFLMFRGLSAGRR